MAGKCRQHTAAGSRLQLRQHMAVAWVAGQAQHDANSVGAQAVDRRRRQARPTRQQPQQYLQVSKDPQFEEFARAVCSA
jgi:hypothetical protein